MSSLIPGPVTDIVPKSVVSPGEDGLCNLVHSLWK